MKKIPALIAAIPLATLVTLIFLTVRCFGDEALSGGCQVALIVASALAATLACCFYRVEWSQLEDSISETIRRSAPAMIILLLIGAISGTWMLSGVVPTFIYYGLKILHPSIFLGAACIICAVVSVVTGSSWTTIATIGVALMGIGDAQGFSHGWTAGAIISGAYFGDKISALSDTTVLSSTTAEVPIFQHIKYMSITTTPSFLIAVLVFTLASICGGASSTGDAATISEALESTFTISPWILLVPAFTFWLIYRRMPAMITLFLAIVTACIAMVIFQPQIISEICSQTSMQTFKALSTSVFGATAIHTGNDVLDPLVSTHGMQGMMDTIWLILCAMCFGGVMTGCGMVESITLLFHKVAKRTFTIVFSTVCTGLFCNTFTSDQYISLIISGNTFKDLYHKHGLENRLLSRTIEDSVTVTSVLIPWSTCGMTQATVLGVGTLEYLPYCIFNYLSPLMSLLVAALGFEIYKNGKKVSNFRFGRHAA